MTFSEFREKFNIRLSAQQEQAVLAHSGAVLLLAVPGSGKTTVLVTRLGYMVFCREIEPEEILTMTYTVSATRDMRDRLASIFGGELASRLEFRTINGISSIIIRLYERFYDRKAFDLLDNSARQSAIIADIYRRVHSDFATESVIKSIATSITFAKNMMLNVEQIAEIEIENVDFAKVFEEYNKTLRAQNLMDYDDQMVYAYQILRKYPQVLEHFQQRYKYFCVDEAQDTSKIQHEIIALLCSESKNIFMVGDEDQSIYGFRAAYPEALMRFERSYENAKVLLMEENFRSSANIVTMADKFIKLNQNRHEKHMKTARSGGAEVAKIAVMDRRAQYKYLLQVAKNCDCETAVLYRDNDSALPLIDMMEREGIAYRVRQVESGFFSSRIVRDITDIINFAKNPYDSELFMRVYYKFSAGISRAIAESAVRRSRDSDTPILRCVLDSGDLSQWVAQKCAALHTHLANLLTDTGERAIYRIVTFMGYGEYLESRGGDSSKIVILEALGASEPTPMALLDRLDTLAFIVRSGATMEPSNFILSTIHSSKGMEYDRVFLCDIIDGILPKEIPATSESQEVYEEERRLFYVGMTRAKNQLSVFTFNKVGLPSVFCSAVFPQKETTVSKKIRKLEMQAVLNSRELARRVEDFSVGMEISHKRFGKCLILDIDGDIVTIELADGEVKKIMLSMALKMKFIVDNA